MLGSSVRTLLATHRVTSRGSYKALHSYPKQIFFQKIGPKHWDKTKLWIPTMVYYSLTLFLGTAYFCDWKYICQLIPFYYEICRLCLSKEDMMTPIFEEDDKTKKDMPSLATRILMCASLQVEEGDGFPSQICTKCSGHLDNWYAFKEQCHSSDATLRQHLQTDSKVEWENNGQATINEESQDSRCVTFDGPCAIQEISTVHGKIPVEMCTVNINDEPPPIDSAEPNKKEVEIKLEETSTLEERCGGNIPLDDSGISNCTLEEKYISTAQSPRRKQSEKAAKVLCEKRYVCSNCPKKYKYAYMLRNHYSSSHNIHTPAFLCSECNKVFHSIKHLREHKRQDHQQEKTKDRSYICNLCGVTLNSLTNLKRHLQNVHSKNKQEHKQCVDLCSFCGRSFRSSGNLKKHILRVHTENPPRELCNICGKTYTNLKIHLLTHSEQYYKCSECGHSSKWKQCFINHLRVHSSERPISCSFCDKSFKDKKKLNQHIRTHTGEMPYMCKHCGRSFSRRWNHIQHVRLHTGAMPYVCAVCGEAFRHNVTMKKHAERHKLPSDSH